MPVILPQESLVIGEVAGSRRFRSLSSLAKDKGQRTKDKGQPPKRQSISRANTLRFEVPKPPEAQKPKETKRRERKKNDPKLVAAARELRDRWLEHVNANEGALLPAGKYEVSSTLRLRPEGSRGMEAASVAMEILPAPERKALPNAA